MPHPSAPRPAHLAAHRSTRRRRARLAAGALAAVAVAGAGLLGGCGGDGGGDPPAVRDGWAFPVADDAAAVYMTITAGEGDELTAARVDRTLAARAEVVNPTSAGEDGPGHLGHLDPGGNLGGEHGHTVVLPADEPIDLEPDGAYLTVGPLAEPLAAGDTFPVTLTFREAADLTVDVTVRTTPP